MRYMLRINRRVRYVKVCLIKKRLTYERDNLVTSIMRRLLALFAKGGAAAEDKGKIQG